MADSKKNPKAEFDDFLKTHTSTKRQCQTCKGADQGMLDNIATYVKRRIEGKTSVSWPALAEHFKEMYGYTLTGESLQNHCLRCLGDLSEALATHRRKH